jgi:hypothetical protein
MHHAASIDKDRLNRNTRLEAGSDPGSMSTKKISLDQRTITKYDTRTRR